MSGKLPYITEGILNKQILSDSDFCALRMGCNSDVTETLNELRGAILRSNRNMMFSSFANFTTIFARDYYSSSDSQQSVRQEQIRKDARAINAQAREHAARIFAFEKPFPKEEPSPAVEVRDVSRVLKLRKRT